MAAIIFEGRRNTAIRFEEATESSISVFTSSGLKSSRYSLMAGRSAAYSSGADRNVCNVSNKGRGGMFLVELLKKIHSYLKTGRVRISCIDLVTIEKC